MLIATTLLAMTRQVSPEPAVTVVAAEVAVVSYHFGEPHQQTTVCPTGIAMLYQTLGLLPKPVRRLEAMIHSRTRNQSLKVPTIPEIDL